MDARRRKKMAVRSRSLSARLELGTELLIIFGTATKLARDIRRVLGSN